MKRFGCALALFAFFVASSSPAIRAETSGPLAALQFLLGEWEGAGDQAGATGGFTFALRVQGRVIVRTNYSNTPANGATPASRHDDLMVIFAEDGLLKADYFDSEGHVIRYVVQGRPGEVVFVSEKKPAEPQYRLTYIRRTETTVDGKFEIAPRGKEGFTPYLTWKARKIR
jgi:hypothetical protein